MSKHSKLLAKTLKQHSCITLFKAIFLYNHNGTLPSKERWQSALSVMEYFLLLTLKYVTIPPTPPKKENKVNKTKTLFISCESSSETRSNKTESHP